METAERRRQDWNDKRTEEIEVHFAKWIGLEHRKKVHGKIQSTFDIFFRIEHRLRKEEMEEQFNREAKEGWRFAADAARITYETAGSEDRKHTLNGVFVAVDSNLGAVVGERKEEQLRLSQEMKEELPRFG